LIIFQRIRILIKIIKKIHLNDWIWSLKDIPIKSWGQKCFKTLEKAKDYIQKSNYFAKENLDDWLAIAWKKRIIFFLPIFNALAKMILKQLRSNFTAPFSNYLKVRGIEDGQSEPIFPIDYDVIKRDQFYKTIAGKEFAGCTGIDSVLIAYDAILGCNGDWMELCLRAMLHGGDNDSTGCIAGSFYGALYGLANVPQNNYKVNRLLIA
jgi:hypothetical protein